MDASTIVAINKRTLELLEPRIDYDPFGLRLVREAIEYLETNSNHIQHHTAGELLSGIGSAKYMADGTDKYHKIFRLVCDSVVAVINWGSLHESTQRDWGLLTLATAAQHAGMAFRNYIYDTD